MAFVNHNQVVVAPVDMLQIQSVARSPVSGKVGMEEDVVAQAVVSNGIVLVVGTEGLPIVVQFLRTEHKHRLIAVFIIFHHRQRSKGLAQSHTVGKDAAVISFQFVDDGKRCILLEVIEFVPDDAVLKTSAFIGQHILGYVFKKLIENIVEREEIDVFRGILLIHGINVLQYTFGNVGELFRILPLLIENSEISLRSWRWKDIDNVIDLVAPFESNLCGGELIERQIDMRRVLPLHMEETTHLLL